MTDDTRPVPPDPSSEAEPAQSAVADGEPLDASSPAIDASPDEVTRERDEYRDLLLRKSAEFDNYRKRVDRERTERDQTAAVDLIEDLLPLVDDLERALSADTGTDPNAYRDGVELIHRQLLEVLAKRGVAPIETTGQPFDPHYHQAVAHDVSPDHADGEVIEELRRGYMLRGRLLRAAMVRVAKG